MAVIFPPLILAGAIVFILNPFITMLQHKGIPRLAGVALTYLGFLAVAVLIGLVMYPAVHDQGDNLADRWPTIRTKMERWVDDRAESVKGTPFEFDRQKVTEAFSNTDVSVRDQIDRVAKVGVKVFHVLLVMVLTPIFAFYLLVDLPHLKRVADGLIPPGASPRLTVVRRSAAGFDWAMT